MGRLTSSVVAGLLCVVFGAAGAIIRVPDDRQTMAEALAVAADGDLIYVHGTLTEGGVLVDKSVTIRGYVGRQAVWQADPVKGNASQRIVSIAAGATVTIKDLVFRNGAAVTAGTGFDGGGIHNAGQLLLEDCVVSGNVAGPGGGNPGGRGGGIYNAPGATLSITNCTIQDNEVRGDTADDGGGGIFNDADGSPGILVVQDSTFASNQTPSAGGGICNLGTASVATSTLVGNTALNPTGPSGSDHGGGIANEGALTLLNSTLSNNYGESGGGGVYNNGTATVTNCSIVANGSGNGGGIYNTATGGVTIGNSLVGYNEGLTGPDLSGTFITLDYNLVQHPDGGTFVGSTTHHVTGQDPKIDSLADNGGPTQTWALQFDSPAIDAGNDGVASPTDQRGYSRSGTSDIGAYEYLGAPPPWNMSEHVFEVDIHQDWSHGTPGENLAYTFEFEAVTDESIDSVEFLTPAGNTFQIQPSSRRADEVATSTWVESDGRMHWNRRAAYDLQSGLDAYGTGAYTVTFHPAVGLPVSTQVDYSVPGSGDPIAQPTAVPVITYPEHNSQAGPRLTFQWEAVNDASATDLFLEVKEADGFRMPVNEELAPSATEYGPVVLAPGGHFCVLTVATLYRGTNSDGIAFAVGNASSSKHDFTVPDTVAAHLFSVGIFKGIDYGPPARANGQYTMSFNMDTDQSVNRVTLTPAGWASPAFSVTPADQGESYENGVWREVWYDYDPGAGSAEWGIDLVFDDKQDWDEYGPGWYTVEIDYGGRTTASTQVWFGRYTNGTPEPGTSLPELTVVPALDSPADGAHFAAGTSVDVTWSAISTVEPKANAIHLEVERSWGTWETILEGTYPANQAGQYTIDQDGPFEIFLAYGHAYGLQEDLTNDDGVEVSVASFTGSDYTVVIGDFYRIAGQVAYNGAANGQLFVEVFSDPQMTQHVDTDGETDGGKPTWNYQRQFLTPGTYYLSAFLDVDGNHGWDSATEPRGYYGLPGAPQAVTLGPDAAGIDFEVLDPPPATVAAHLFSVGIFKGIDYGPPARANGQYTMGFNMDTDQSVNRVTLTPAGWASPAFSITPADQGESYQNGVWREVWYDYDPGAGSAEWGIYLVFDDKQDWDEYGPGWYTVAIEYGGRTTASTQVWFGRYTNGTPEPGTSLPELTVVPALDSPADGAHFAAGTPVDVTWSAISTVEPKANAIHLEVERSWGTWGTILEGTYPANQAGQYTINEDGPVSISFDYSHAYGLQEDLSNDDGVEVSVASFTGSDYTVVIGDFYRLAGQVSYGGEANGQLFVEVFSDPQMTQHVDTDGETDGGKPTWNYQRQFLTPGTYYLSAFLDVDGNHGWDSATEPRGYYGLPGALQAVTLGPDATSLNFALADPQGLRSISGMVGYDGPQQGTILVQAFDNESFAGTPIGDAELAAPGAYTIPDLPTGADYYVRAFRDSDGDQQPGPAEAIGEYSVARATAVTLNADATGIDIALQDPDVDHDGLPDWWELFYFPQYPDLDEGPGGNPDGDPLSNRQEYENGLNPTVADLVDFVDVTAGWNLVSIPANATPPTLAGVFDGHFRGTGWTWNGRRYISVPRDQVISDKSGFWIFVPPGHAGRWYFPVTAR